MAQNICSFLVIASILLLIISQCCSQVTFSRNWEGAGGKRSGHPVIPVPEIYFKITGNSICQYLLSEIKQMSPCEAPPEEAAPIFSTS